MLILLLMLMLMGACGPGGLFEDSSQKATREAQDQINMQTLQFIETQAATLVSLELTADHANAMGTQIVQLGAQNQSLQATIDAVYGGVQQQPVQPVPQAGQPGQALQPGAGTTPLFPQTGSSFTATPPQFTQSTGTAYTQATTASRVRDSDGCAEDSVSTFTVESEQIYMVVAAQNVQSGTTFYTRWLRDSQLEFETVSWTPQENFDQICIWFYIEPADVIFEPGYWTVEFVANNLTAVSRSFSIVDDSAQQQQNQAVPTTPSGNFIGDQSSNQPRETESVGE